MVLALTEEGKNPRQIAKEAAIPLAIVNKVLKRVKVTKRKRHAPYRIKTL